MLNRAEQQWPSGEVTEIAARDFRAEMQAVTCNILGGVQPKSVKLSVEGHEFRCVPSVDGRVILYKDGQRRFQYHVMPLDEWATWASECSAVPQSSHN